jgi:hypothetical protein
MIIKTDEHNLESTLNSFIQSNKQYQYGYISIGSKYNQLDVYFKSGSNTLANRVDTNAIIQMVPMFLRNKPPNMHILNIIIDIFPTQIDMDMNERFITSVIPDNMDCILINMKCTATNLNEQFINIMERVLHQNINPLSFIICNYVKHMNEPNKAEYETEIMIPTCIQHVLNNPRYNKYSTCYYEWYGYKFNLYNCIYNASFAQTDLYFYQTTSYLINYISWITKPLFIPSSTNPHSKLDNLLQNSYDISYSTDVELEGECNRITYPMKYTLQM